MHAAMGVGVVIFALVTHFVLRPARTGASGEPDIMTWALAGISLAALVAGIFLRLLVPSRSGDEPADAFWPRAAGPAIVTWGALEMAGLAAVVAYMRSGLLQTLGLAAIALIASAVLNPAYFERR